MWQEAKLVSALTPLDKEILRLEKKQREALEV